MLRNICKRFCLLFVILLVVINTVSCNALEKCFFPLKYEEYIYEYGDLYGIPYDLLAAVIKTESDFNPEAVSGAGAVGLMQLLPSTAETIAESLKVEYNADMLTDPKTNIAYGCYYLSYLYRNLGYNWATACAAYNAGIGRVKSWLNNEEYSDDGKTLKNIPFDETNRYIKEIERNREKYSRLYFSQTEDNKND